MEVRELITELERLPQDAWVDAMFPEGGDAFAVIGVDTITLDGGRKIAILDITDNFKPGLVA